MVIHQLPNTPETLFLRILGRGKVQRQAVEELENLLVNKIVDQVIVLSREKFTPMLLQLSRDQLLARFRS